MSNPKEQEIASLRAWSESAPYWDKHASVIRAMFAPLSDALIEDAALGPGKSALDVAAGTGEPSLRIAEVCGPSSSVICTDPVADMIAVAKREASDLGSLVINLGLDLALAIVFGAMIGWLGAWSLLRFRPPREPLS